MKTSLKRLIAVAGMSAVGVILGAGPALCTPDLDNMSPDSAILIPQGKIIYPDPVHSGSNDSKLPTGGGSWGSSGQQTEDEILAGGAKIPPQKASVIPQISIIYPDPVHVDSGDSEVPPGGRSGGEKKSGKSNGDEKKSKKSKHAKKVSTVANAEELPATPMDRFPRRSLANEVRLIVRVSDPQAERGASGGPVSLSRPANSANQNSIGVPPVVPRAGLTRGPKRIRVEQTVVRPVRYELANAAKPRGLASKERLPSPRHFHLRQAPKIPPHRR